MKKPKKGKDGFYCVQRQVGLYPDGKRHYERFRDKNWDSLLLQIAQRRAEFAEEISRGEVSKAHKAEPVMTLLLAIDKYIDTCRVLCDSGDNDFSPATIAGYASIRRSVEKHPAFDRLANMPLSAVTVDHIQSAMDSAASTHKLSPKTLRNWWGVIKPAIDKYGPDLRLDKVRLAKNRSKKPMTIREADIPTVLRIAREMGDDFFLYVLFTAVLGTRHSESYALTWGDISAEPIVSIRDGKPQLYGEIFIEKARVCDEFGKYREKCTKTDAGTRSLSRPWVFFEQIYAIRPRGRDDEHIIRLKPGLAPYRWNKLKEQVALPDDMVMYDLRHYHASVMIACGADVTYIANDMGHSDIAITRKYYAEEIAEKRQEINTEMYARVGTLLESIAE